MRRGPSTMPAPSLKLIVLKTNDVESLRNFYTQIGFRFVEEQHGKGPVHSSAALGGGILEFYPLPDGSEADSTTRLGFAVTGAESVVESLTDTAEVVSKPKATEWGTRAVVRDPDGRSVELYEASDYGDQLSEVFCSDSVQSLAASSLSRAHSSNGHSSMGPTISDLFVGP